MDTCKLLMRFIETLAKDIYELFYTTFLFRTALEVNKDR